MVWRQAVRAESAVLSKRFFCQLLWDMRKYFDTIRWQALVARAEEYGFPSFVLRVTLAGYRFARRFKIGILVTKEYWPCCGVVPGCGNAAFMVMLHQIGPLDKLVLRLAPLSVRLQVYYDDMGMDADREQEGHSWKQWMLPQTR